MMHTWHWFYLMLRAVKLKLLKEIFFPTTGEENFFKITLLPPSG
jgi:hypothetical protein